MALASFGALVLFLASERLGLKAVALVFGVGLGLALLERPRVAVGLLLVSCVLFEYRAPEGLFASARVFYDPVVAGLSPQELLFGGAVSAVALDVAQRERFSLPGPLTIPLALLALGIAIGGVTGYAASSSLSVVVPPARALAMIVVTPLVIVNVVRDEDLPAVLKLATGLIALKALAGLLAVATGQGSASLFGDTITYSEPTTNFLMMLFLIVIAAALLLRAHLSRWLWIVAPLAFACLLFSYRRGFWLGTVVGLSVVLVLAGGRFGRRLLVPAVMASFLAVGAALSTGAVPEIHGSVTARVQSLTSVTASAQDRYRVGERRNVVADIEDSPLIGLGLGQPWHGRYGVSVAFANARTYVHMAVLSWWLKMGVVGALAYLVLMGAALWIGSQVGRLHPDRLIRAVGYGAAGALLGLMTVELTASHTGIDPAFSTVVGALLGMLVVARRRALAADASATPEPWPSR